MAHDYKHASTHTDGSTDQIQDATDSVKGLATDTQITKLDGIEASADVTDATNVAAAGAVMDSDISEAEGIVRKTGAGAYAGMKTNLAASVAPTANEDSGDGYVVGSIWIDTTADKAYICLDNTATAAVWTEITQAGGGGGGDMTVGDPKVAAAETSSAAWSTVINVSSGSGYLHSVFQYGVNSAPIGRIRITIDGGTALATGGNAASDMNNDSSTWPFGGGDGTIGLCSAGGAPLRFASSMLVEHYRDGGTVVLRTLVSYTLDQ